MKLSHKQWLEERRKSIGGSDAAALVGMSPYATPYMVWADKTGRLPPKEDSEAMRQGRDLEEYVAKRFCEKNEKKVHIQSGIIRNPAYPYAHATIDRKVTGERAGLECKTTSAMNLKKFKNGEYPENYYAQCMHYLAVTGWERWYLAVLVLGRDFQTFTIERDEEEIKALMETERDFWEKYVACDVPPPVDGLIPTSETLSAIYPISKFGESVDLMGRERLIEDYLSTQELIKSYKRENEQRKQILQQDLGESPEGITGRYVVTWRVSSRLVFNTEAFQKDYEKIDLAPYYKTSEFRKFNIKELK